MPSERSEGIVVSFRGSEELLGVFVLRVGENVVYIACSTMMPFCITSTRLHI